MKAIMWSVLALTLPLCFLRAEVVPLAPKDGSTFETLTDEQIAVFGGETRTNRLRIVTKLKTSPTEAVREAQVSFDGGAPKTVRFANGRAEMNVPEFRLWSPETPHLHSVRVAAEGFGAAEARFGVRQFTCAKGKFWLNGSPVFLKGVNRHDSDYANGYATSRISMWRDLKLIKGLGANFVRTSHYPPSRTPSQSPRCAGA